MHFSSNHSLPCAYDILGLMPGASENEIKAAFRQHAKRCHPDVALDGNVKTAGEEFLIIEDAYSQLLGRKTQNEDAGHRTEDETDWQHETEQFVQSSLPSPLQLAALFAMPAGMLYYNCYSVHKTEQDILKSGGWACVKCTFVNPAGSSECPGCKFWAAEKEEQDRRDKELEARPAPPDQGPVKPGHPIFRAHY